MIDVFFDLHDLAGNHPGPESHKMYADSIKNIMKENGWYSEEKI